MIVQRIRALALNDGTRERMVEAWPDFTPPHGTNHGAPSRWGVTTKCRQPLNEIDFLPGAHCFLAAELMA